ncbi:MAG: hypothetical protein OEV78_09290 [Spirochaetia bacterium]|nr:hypothetical protein [Spirochaetia bacterium]
MNTSASLDARFEFLMMNDMKQNNFYGIAGLISGRRTAADIWNNFVSAATTVVNSVGNFFKGLFGW